MLHLVLVNELFELADPLEPAAWPTVRKNHARMNDLALVRGSGAVTDGTATVALAIPQGLELAGHVVKAWALTETDVHQGARILD